VHGITPVPFQGIKQKKIRYQLGLITDSDIFESSGLGHYQPFASRQNENVYHEDENKAEKADNAGLRNHTSS
jgi:hypothetical protein